MKNEKRFPRVTFVIESFSTFFTLNRLFHNFDKKLSFSQNETCSPCHKLRVHLDMLITGTKRDSPFFYLWICSWALILSTVFCAPKILLSTAESPSLMTWMQLLQRSSLVFFLLPLSPKLKGIFKIKDLLKRKRVKLADNAKFLGPSVATLSIHMIPIQLGLLKSFLVNL